MKPGHSRETIDNALAAYNIVRQQQKRVEDTKGMPLPDLASTPGYISQATILEAPAGGKCHGVQVDSSLFDPKDPRELIKDYRDRIFKAKRICKACPLSTLCLLQAIEYEQTSNSRHANKSSLGVRGGLSFEERRSLIK